MYRTFLSRFLDLIAPRQCAVCGCRLSVSEESVCGCCNMQLPRTDFALHPSDNTMTRLLWGEVAVERGAALFHYHPEADTAQLIHQAKYYFHPELCDEMGRMMARELLPTAFFNGIDLLVPIPLTMRRQRQRGYNQSEQLARGISHITHIPVETRAVKRRHFHGSQTHKDHTQRREDVREAFQLSRPDRITGRHLLLIDDVMTTGATVCACARELLKADGVRISVLTLGFTAR